jgi:chemotaxis protein methyltransferase CheR
MRELDLLLEALRVGETRFFRHRSHIHALTDVVVPRLRARKDKRTIKAWSAGCASGEEAFTLAMILRKSLPAFDVSVLATDMSTEALDVARGRRYPEASLSHVPAEWRGWAFEATGDGAVRVRDEVANLVSYERRNLADGSYPRGFDVIWCRNVLIYFTPVARERVVTRLVDSLVDDGFLFVGYAESLRDFSEVEAVRTPDTVLYRKAQAPPRAPAPVPALIPRVAHAPAPAPRPVTVPPAGLTPEEATVELRGRYDDGARLADELAEAIRGPYHTVIVELDGADYLGDEAAAVLRRARSAARAAGVTFTLVADRAGTQRWLRRSGLEDAS